MRSRILASYLVLIVLASGLSFLAIHEALVINLERRVAEAMRQEFLEVNRLLAEGRDPLTGRPFASLAAALDIYFERNVPSHEEALLAFVDGRLHRAALSRFPVTEVPTTVMAQFAAPPAQVSGDHIGRFETPHGAAYFAVLTLRLADTSGTFVVTILPAAERREIRNLQSYGVAALLGVLLLASACAWFVTGRVLVPVRLLTATAQLISQSDLTRRIPVRGDDEAAEMTRTFNAMLDRLEVVVRKQREFILDTSHELRGPLAVCMGNLGLLEHGLIGDSPAERQETIALVTDELERMGRIVDDLRLLADTAHPNFLQVDPIELRPFTHELAGKLRALAPRDWQIDAVAVDNPVADRHRLTQAVIALADNAVHHTTTSDTIAIGTSVDGHEFRIWVRDTGCGIPVADQARILERFQRGADANLRYRGSGLGLAIVKAIVESHGGRVEVLSGPHEGAVFTLVIPRLPRAGWVYGPDIDR